MGLLVSLGLRRRPSPFERPRILDRLASPLLLVASLFYRLVQVLRSGSSSSKSSPRPPPRGQPSVRVVCISDTHGHIVQVPPGDVLVHAGDLTNDRSAHAIQKQLDWLKSLPHPIKILVAGNHDSFFDARTHPYIGEKKGPQERDSKRPRDVLDLGGLLYLEGEHTVQHVKGRRLVIFGAPDIPVCGPKSFAFQYTPASQPWFSRVHPQTDILITHGPPKHHLDNGTGCPHLLRETWRIRPRLHIFGHVHCGYGSEPIYYDDLQRAYERLLTRCPDTVPLADVLDLRAWTDFFDVVVLGVRAVTSSWFGGASDASEGGVMVNAAQMYENTGLVMDRAIVVDI